MTYKEQLLDPRWQKKRLEILSRDEFRCQQCYDDNKTLMVHHLYYGKGLMAWEAENEHLLTLCKECHDYFHDRMPEYQKVVLNNMKLKLKDCFITGCAADLFKDFKNLHQLIYILWEAKEREDELLELLRDFIFPGAYELYDHYELKPPDAKN